MHARFLTPAIADVEDAAAYLDSQREGLGERFERDVAQTAAFAAENPDTGKPLTSVIRLRRLRKFRYNIIYAVEEDGIVIIAVAHHRRRPDFWRRRLQ